MATMESNETVVNEFLDFLTGAGAARRPTLDFDQTKAVWHLAAMLRTGRILHSKGVEPTVSLLASRQLAMTLLTNFDALQLLTHPVWSRMVVLLDDGSAFGVERRVDELKQHPPGHTAGDHMGGKAVLASSADDTRPVLVRIPTWAVQDPDLIRFMRERVLI